MSGDGSGSHQTEDDDRHHHRNNDNNSQSVGDEEVERAMRREARKLRRVQANKRAARESRDRRKRLLTDLQASIDNLAQENQRIAETNLAMRQELLQLLAESGLAATLQQLQGAI